MLRDIFSQIPVFVQGHAAGVGVVDHVVGLALLGLDVHGHLLDAGHIVTLGGIVGLGLLHQGGRVPLAGAELDVYFLTGLGGGPLAGSRRLPCGGLLLRLRSGGLLCGSFRVGYGLFDLCVLFHL